MLEDKVVLAVSNTYEKSYYFNDEFDQLPQQVQDEIKILCVKHVAEVGGILALSFDDEGTLEIEAIADEDDILYDEIGSHLKIKQIQIEHRDLFEALEAFFKVFYLGED